MSGVVFQQLRKYFYKQKHSVENLKTEGISKEICGEISEKNAGRIYGSH